MKSVQNDQMNLANSFIRDTGVNIFLTGKAGTGKTTFLRSLAKTTRKRMVVLAPTGIAAINAGGMTIHSFFQLPFAPFIPGVEFGKDAQMSMKLVYSKLKIIRTLQLLVIDEVSMVRADLLDAVDYALQKFRRNTRPFGGVQLLLIGDLQQLPPVVKDEDWELLKQQYDSPFFFSSIALRRTHFVTIELTHVYRQQDETFIQVLNQIRDNKITVDSLKLLNTRYLPEFNPKDHDGYITLTTHNHQANKINEERLKEISNPAFTFRAVVKDNFPESSYPTDERLTLKLGAQVMFIKNDPSQDKMYFNGKIGVITHINDSTIRVQGEGDETPIEVKMEEWSNVRYVLNKITNEIDEKVEGTFKQFPLKAAWAITVHKSQGLTFDKAYISVNAAFAHGQVYVAISRCRTLEGIVLSAPLYTHAIKTDQTVSEFVRHVEDNPPTEGALEQYQQDYFRAMVQEMVTFTEVRDTIHRIYTILIHNMSQQYPELISSYEQLLQQFPGEILDIAEKFGQQIHHLVVNSEDYIHDAFIQERIDKASNFFLPKIEERVTPLYKKTLLVKTRNKELANRLNQETLRLKELMTIKVNVIKIILKRGFTVERYEQAKISAELRMKEMINKKEKDQEEI